MITGEIKRDCFAAFAQCKDPDECEKCNSELCNGSKFPADRISCHQCEGCDVATGDPLICPLHFPFKKMCYERIAGNFVTRGCVSTPNNYCLRNGYQCVYCLTDGCNRSPKETDQSIQCYTCSRDAESADLDFKCALPQSMDLYKVRVFRTYSARMQMGSVLYCWTVYPGINSSSIIRLNGLDKEFEELKTRFCQVTETRIMCQKCSGDLCNDDGSYGKCYESLESNDKLSSAYLLPIECSPGLIATYGCYIHKILGNESLVRRGCITDMTYYQYSFCGRYNNDCKFCHSKFCNHDFRKLACYQCAEVTDANYVNYCRTELIREKQTDCPQNDDRCFLFDNGSYVARDCVSRAFNRVALSSKASFCETNLCNSRKSLGKIQCYTGMTNSVVLNCTSGQYGCYVVVFRDQFGEERFERGCYSVYKKYSPNQMNCDLHWEFCNICTSNLCNEHLYTHDPILSCVKCNDTKDCEFYKANREPKACKSPIRFMSDESCFYGVYENRSIRGCTVDLFGSNSTPPGELSYCKAPGCNTASLNRFSCFMCESKESDKNHCRTVVDETGEKLAPVSICEGDQFYTSDRKGCYLYKTPLNIVKRGCIRYLPEVIRKFCDNEDQSVCQLCLEEACNYKEILSSVGQKVKTAFRIAVLVLYLCVILNVI